MKKDHCPDNTGIRSEPNYASRESAIMPIMLAAVLALLGGKVLHSLNQKPLGIPDNYVDHTPKPEEFLRELLKGHPEISAAINDRGWITQLESMNLSDLREMKEKFGETITVNGYQVSTEAFVANLSEIHKYFNAEIAGEGVTVTASSSNEPPVMQWVKAVEGLPVSARTRD